MVKLTYGLVPVRIPACYTVSYVSAVTEIFYNISPGVTEILVLWSGTNFLVLKKKQNGPCLKILVRV